MCNISWQDMKRQAYDNNGTSNTHLHISLSMTRSPVINKQKVYGNY